MDELVSFVAGAELLVRDLDSQNVPAPLWIEQEAGSLYLGDWVAKLKGMHPTDRAPFGRAWWMALQRPGEVTETTTRTRVGDDWHRERMRCVDLRLHPEVGAILIAFDGEVTVGEIADDASSPGEHFESAPWVIHHLDSHAAIKHSDGMVEHLYGRPADKLVGEYLLRFVHAEDQGACIGMWLQASAAPDTPCTTLHRIFRPDKTTIWVESTVMKQLYGEPGHMVQVCHDVTERRAREAERAEREAALSASRANAQILADEFRLLAEEVPAAVFRLDASGIVTFGNARWFELVSGAGAVTGLRDAAHVDDRATIDGAIKELVAAVGDDRRSFEVRSADGTRTLSLTCRAVGGPGGHHRAIMGAVHDVTATVELRRRAEYDILTGTLNRHSLDLHLEEAVRNRPDVLVVFVDLDGFKAVNDGYGHDAGDLVLQGVAERLRRAVRPTDDVGRYGGDEFVIVCYDSSPSAEGPITARIERLLKHPITFPGGQWIPQASLGTARPGPGDDHAAVVHRADQAMYAAKRARQICNQGPLVAPLTPMRT